MRARRRHAFGYGARGVVACRHCGVERRAAFFVTGPAKVQGGVVFLFRDAARSSAWTSEKPGCVS